MIAKDIFMFFVIVSLGLTAIVESGIISKEVTDKTKEGSRESVEDRTEKTKHDSSETETESSQNSPNGSDLNESKAPAEKTVDDSNVTTNTGLKIEIKDPGIFDIEEEEEKMEKASEKPRSEKSVTNQGTTVAVKKLTEIEEHNTEYVVHERKVTTNIGLQNSKAPFSEEDYGEGELLICCKEDQERCIPCESDEKEDCIERLTEMHPGCEAIEMTEDLNEKGELKVKIKEIATPSAMHATATPSNAESVSGKEHRVTMEKVLDLAEEEKDESFTSPVIDTTGIPITIELDLATRKAVELDEDDNVLRYEHELEEENEVPEMQKVKDVPANSASKVASSHSTGSNPTESATEPGKTSQAGGYSTVISTGKVASSRSTGSNPNETATESGKASQAGGHSTVISTEKFKLVRENTGFNKNCTGQEYVDEFPGDLSDCAKTVGAYKDCTDTFFFSNSSGICMCEKGMHVHDRTETCARENSTEFNEYIAITDPNPCCFKYGFGARMVPCCLNLISCDEHDKLENRTLVGGAMGKHHFCPNDAAHAHQLVSGIPEKSNKCQEKLVMGRRFERVRLAKSTAEFTQKLGQAALKVLGEKEYKKNKFVSPFSIQSALGMLLLGSKGKTREQILKNVFPSFQGRHGPGTSAWDLMDDTMKSTWEMSPHGSVLDVTNRISHSSSSGNGTFNVANRMYVQKTFNILPTFKEETESCYLASAAKIDFKNNPDESRVEINKWVKNKTMDKIEELLPPNSLTSDTRFVLVNAIYFYGTWKYQFDTNKTKKAKFSVIGKKSNATASDVEVDMMYQSGNFTVCKPDGIDAQVLQMNYTGDRLSMVIVLPNKVDGLSGVQESMGKFDYNKCIKGKTLSKIDVSIPTFEIKSEYKMKNLLSEIGIKDVFDGKKADLSGISSKPLYVDEVYHEAYIKVNEEGTEAAASTGVVGTFNRHGPPSFYCTHPFMFMIVENEMGTILFTGTVTDPSKGVDEKKE